MNPFTTTPYADAMGTADGAAHRVAREGNDGGRPDRRPARVCPSALRSA